MIWTFGGADGLEVKGHGLAGVGGATATLAGALALVHLHLVLCTLGGGARILSWGETTPEVPSPCLLHLKPCGWSTLASLVIAGSPIASYPGPPSYMRTTCVMCVTFEPLHRSCNNNLCPR
jgi:hypothetical protein